MLVATDADSSQEKLKALDMDKKRLQKLMLAEKEKSRAL